MRSLYNAVWDVLNELNLLDTLQETVTADPDIRDRWIVTFETLPNSANVDAFLQIEVLDETPDCVICVLERRNVRRTTMERMMNKLMDRLDRSPRSSEPSERRPLGGSPLPSPEQDTNESQEDDT